MGSFGGMGPLELGGALDEEPMDPWSNRGPLNQEQAGLFKDHGVPWS